MHETFLKNPSCFSWKEDAADGGCVRYNSQLNQDVQGRFSINMFLFRLADTPKLVELIKSDKGDDEHAWSTLADKQGHQNCFMPFFDASHLMFGGQKVRTTWICGTLSMTSMPICISLEI